MAAVMDGFFAHSFPEWVLILGEILVEGFLFGVTPREPSLLIGSVIVGPPIPPFDLERRLTKDYFDRSCGEGEAYTYIYPAMAKAIQAAGRVIRGPGERGLLAFLDPRFLEPAFAQCFPQDWFLKSPQEAVSDQILADVARFWSQA